MFSSFPVYSVAKVQDLKSSVGQKVNGRYAMVLSHHISDGVPRIGICVLPTTEQEEEVMRVKRENLDKANVEQLSQNCVERYTDILVSKVDRHRSKDDSELAMIALKCLSKVEGYKTPLNVRIYYSEILYGAEKYDQAIEELHGVVSEANEKNHWQTADFKYNLALCYLESDQINEALNVAKTIAHRESSASAKRKKTRMLEMILHLMYRAKMADGIVEVSTEILKIDPDHEVALCHVARTYCNEEKIKEGSAVIEKAIRTSRHWMSEKEFDMCRRHLRFIRQPRSSDTTVRR